MEHYWIKFNYWVGSGTPQQGDEFISCSASHLPSKVAELRKKYTGMKVDLIVKL